MSQPSAAELLAAIQSGKTLYVQTATRVTPINAKTVAAFDAAGTPILRDAQLALFEQRDSDFLAQCREIAAQICRQQGWENVVEMGILPPRHWETANNLSNDCLQAGFAGVRLVVRGPSLGVQAALLGLALFALPCWSLRHRTPSLWRWSE